MDKASEGEVIFENENIILPAKLKRAFDETYYNYLIHSLGLEERVGHFPSEISGGQQQRVAIARALITYKNEEFQKYILQPVGFLSTKSEFQV